MILYISNATSYLIYDELFASGKIAPSYQMQKFNHNLIVGLSGKDRVTALSALPYLNVKAERIDRTIDNVRYIGIKNSTGHMHKPMNLIRLFREGSRIIRREKPLCIICDAIAMSPCLISLALGKVFGIPVVGIITDLPNILNASDDPSEGTGMMRKFDAYVLLTQQMNAVVNPKGKPYIIMEGLCASHLPPVCDEKKKKTLIYSGSLWKEAAGIEYLVEGFIQAALPGYELQLYGVGELVPWLEDMGKKHSNVKYMGCVSNAEIVKLQTEASLLVNPRPTDKEFCKYSFPSKTIEYMASGTPVLMTRLPGVPEEYFEYVYTIEEENAAGVQAVLEEIFRRSEQERRSFGLRAREFVAVSKSCEMQTGRIFDFVSQGL